MNLKQSIKRILKEEINNPNKPDLYEIAKWGLTGEYEYSGCWDDNDLDGAIECVVDDFEQFLNEPYPTGLGDIPKNPIIYRLIKLKDINELNKNNLGKSWFSNPNQLKNPEFFDMLEYLKPGPNNKVFLIKGKTTINNIDLKRTLWERSTQWWENEIVIKDDTNIDILDIKELTMDKYLKESNNKLKENVNPIMNLVDEMGIMDTIKYTGLNYDEIKSKINLTKEQKIQFIKDFVTDYDEFEDDGGDLYLETDERIVYKIENEEIHYIESLKVTFDDLIINLWVYDLDNPYEATYPYMLEGEDLSDEELDMVINVLLNLDRDE